MKKLAMFAVIAIMVPGIALAGMGILNESSLNDVTGQVGITIDQTLNADIGSISWTDSDGETANSSGYSATGALIINGITVNNGGATTAITMTGLTIDVGTHATSGTALIIGMPDIEGDINIANICLDTAAGTAATATNSLGAVSISTIKLTGSTMTIKAH